MFYLTWSPVTTSFKWLTPFLTLCFCFYSSSLPNVMTLFVLMIWQHKVLSLIYYEINLISENCYFFFINYYFCEENFLKTIKEYFNISLNDYSVSLGVDIKTTYRLAYLNLTLQLFILASSYKEHLCIFQQTSLHCLT